MNHDQDPGITPDQIKIRGPKPRPRPQPMCPLCHCPEWHHANNGGWCCK